MGHRELAESPLWGPCWGPLTMHVSSSRLNLQAPGNLDSAYCGVQAGGQLLGTLHQHVSVS